MKRIATRQRTNRRKQAVTNAEWMNRPRDQRLRIVDRIRKMLGLKLRQKNAMQPCDQLERRQ